MKSKSLIIVTGIFLVIFSTQNCYAKKSKAKLITQKSSSSRSYQKGRPLTTRAVSPSTTKTNAHLPNHSLKEGGTCSVNDFSQKQNNLSDTNPARKVYSSTNQLPTCYLHEQRTNLTAPKHPPVSSLSFPVMLPEAENNWVNPAEVKRHRPKINLGKVKVD